MWTTARCKQFDEVIEDEFNFEKGEFYKINRQYGIAKSWSGNEYYYYPILEWFEECEPNLFERILHNIRKMTKWRAKK